MSPRLPAHWPAIAAAAGATSDDVLVLTGAAACRLWPIVEGGLREVRTNGRAPSQAALAIAATIEQRAERHLAALAAADRRGVTSPGGRPDVRPHAEGAAWPPPTVITVGTTEAARLWGVTARQARRRALKVGGRRGPGRAWVLPRSGVIAAAADTTDRDRPAP